MRKIFPQTRVNHKYSLPERSSIDIGIDSSDNAIVMTRKKTVAMTLRAILLSDQIIQENFAEIKEHHSDKHQHRSFSSSGFIYFGNEIAGADI